MNKLVYTREAAEKIYKELFGVRQSMHRMNALGSYRSMLFNIKMNYDINVMAPKLNELIMPYFDDIKNNPNKVL